MRVDEGGVWLGVVIVLVVVFFGLPGRVDSDGVSRVLAPAGYVISSKNSEAVHPCRIPHGVCLPVVPDVAVLASPLVVADALLPVDDPVLLGEGRAELAGPSVESLLLQDPGREDIGQDWGRSGLMKLTWPDSGRKLGAWPGRAERERRPPRQLIR